MTASNDSIHTAILYCKRVRVTRLPAREGERERESGLWTLDWESGVSDEHSSTKRRGFQTLCQTSLIPAAVAALSPQHDWSTPSPMLQGSCLIVTGLVRASKIMGRPANVTVTASTLIAMLLPCFSGSLLSGSLGRLPMICAASRAGPHLSVPRSPLTFVGHAYDCLFRDSTELCRARALHAFTTVRCSSCSYRVIAHLRLSIREVHPRRCGVSHMQEAHCCPPRREMPWMLGPAALIPISRLSPLSAVDCFPRGFILSRCCLQVSRASGASLITAH